MSHSGFTFTPFEPASDGASAEREITGVVPTRESGCLRLLPDDGGFAGSSSDSILLISGRLLSRFRLGRGGFSRGGLSNWLGESHDGATSRNCCPGECAVGVPGVENETREDDAEIDRGIPIGRLTLSFDSLDDPLDDALGASSASHEGSSQSQSSDDGGTGESLPTDRPEG
jgi:hypothetical protein